ncbi:hypothetical protein PO909_029538, partial [Leuciscus waleckii]
RLQEGLDTLRVLQALQQDSVLCSLFVGGPPAPLTQTMTDLFKVNYSERGSSRRSQEERAVGQWRDWLIDIEGGDDVLTEENEVNVTFDSRLMFATDTDRILALGFDSQPTLEFLHNPVNGSKRLYPEANTCALSLRLSIHASYESFSQYMALGIVQSPHFGLA